MKHSSKLLALGLVLFLGACSTVGGTPSEKIAGKTAYRAGTNTSVTTFSDDGKSFSYMFAKFTMQGETDTTATYSGNSMTIKVEVSEDGKNGTFSDIGVEFK